MGKHPSGNGNINLSAKWLLRAAALALLCLSMLLFFFTSVSFRSCGVLFAGSMACLIVAELTDN